MAAAYWLNAAPKVASACPLKRRGPAVPSSGNSPGTPQGTSSADPSFGRPIARLKKRPEFLRVARTRQKFVTPGLILQMRERESSEAEMPVRVGFTVSRKVGNAVVRNRVRRRLREAAETIIPKYTPGNRDYVIIGRHQAFKLSFPSLLEDLERALKNLGAQRKVENEI